MFNFKQEIPGGDLIFDDEYFGILSASSSTSTLVAIRELDGDIKTSQTLFGDYNVIQGSLKNDEENCTSILPGSLTETAMRPFDNAVEELKLHCDAASATTDNRNEDATIPSSASTISLATTMRRFDNSIALCTGATISTTSVKHETQDPSTELLSSEEKLNVVASAQAREDVEAIPQHGSSIAMMRTSSEVIHEQSALIAPQKTREDAIPQHGSSITIMTRSRTSSEVIDEQSALIAPRQKTRLQRCRCQPRKFNVFKGWICSKIIRFFVKNHFVM